jgi:hypothetical protein
MPDMGPVGDDAAALVGLVARWALAAVFAAAALHAMRDWTRFRGAVAEYRIGPARLALAAGWALPPAEAAVAAALLIPATAQAACAAGAALLLLFALGMAVNVARGRREIDCGCGGADGQTLSWALVSRNVVLAATLAAAAMTGAPAIGAAEGALCLAAAAAVAAMYFVANQLLANRDALAWRSAA